MTDLIRPVTIAYLPNAKVYMVDFENTTTEFHSYVEVLEYLDRCLHAE